MLSQCIFVANMSSFLPLTGKTESQIGKGTWTSNHKVLSWFSLVCFQWKYNTMKNLHLHKRSFCAFINDYIFCQLGKTGYSSWKTLPHIQVHVRITIGRCSSIIAPYLAVYQGTVLVQFKSFPKIVGSNFSCKSKNTKWHKILHGIKV